MKCKKCVHCLHITDKSDHWGRKVVVYCKKFPEGERKPIWCGGYFSKNKAKRLEGKQC